MATVLRWLRDQYERVSCLECWRFTGHRCVLCDRCARRKMQANLVAARRRRALTFPRKLTDTEADA